MSNHTILSINSPPLPYFLEMGKTIYQPGGKHPSRKQLGVFDMLFIVKGCLYIGEEEQEWEAAAGQTLILLPDKYHYAVKPCEAETIFYWIHFQTAGSWQEADSSVNKISSSQPHQEHEISLNAGFYTISLPKYWTLADPDQIYSCVKQILELSVQSRSHAFWLQQQMFLQLLKLMDEGQKANYASPALMVAEKIEAFIKANYQLSLTNRHLAEALHFHPNYIARCMKLIYGCTPMAYLVNYRLEQAKLLLLKTDASISRIAEDSGFQYTPYFSRCFKESHGLSPLQYRKQYAK